MSFRATTMLTALLGLVSGCAPAGFMVNGRYMSDQELLAYQGSWPTDSTTATSKSRLQPEDRQHILNVIAHQEATGATLDGECSSPRLDDIVPVRATHLRVSSAGETIGPMKFAEEWRVLVCGNKHSWIVYEDRGTVGRPTAIYMQVKDNEWLRYEQVPTQR
jgi:hypothetical protein